MFWYIRTMTQIQMQNSTCDDTLQWRHLTAARESVVRLSGLLAACRTRDRAPRPCCPQLEKIPGPSNVAPFCLAYVSWLRLLRYLLQSPTRNCIGRSSLGTPCNNGPCGSEHLGRQAEVGREPPEPRDSYYHEFKELPIY